MVSYNDESVTMVTHIDTSLFYRVNNKLDLKSIPNIVHLNEDLANGVRLLQLLVSCILYLYER